MRKLACWSAGASLLALVVACGGSETSGLGSGGGAGASSGGSSSGGASAGGSSSGGASTGGASSGGAATGGSASGGTSGCAPPTDDSTAALCLDFNPDPVTLYTEDALFGAYDGLGELRVQVFDTPNPTAATAPIDEYIRTSQNVFDLGSTRFDGLPSTVYVRTIFGDNPLFTNPLFRPWVAGGFFGGFDVALGLGAVGFGDTDVLMPVNLVTGEANVLTQDLIAHRGVRVTVTLGEGVVPEDDGIGPAVFLIAETNAFDTAFFGIGATPENTCIDVSGGKSANIDGVVLGAGTFYVAAVVDDLNVGEGSEDAKLWGVAGPITWAPEDYLKGVDVVLTTVNPPPNGPPQSYTCP